MASFRTCWLAALALGLAAPASAGWWPSSGGVAATNVSEVAPHRATAKPAPGLSVPEPADFALFAAGVVGLLLGRRGSRSRRD